MSFVALGESEPSQELLAGTAHATRSTCPWAQRAAPALLVHERGMALPAGYEAGWSEAARKRPKRKMQSSA